MACYIDDMYRYPMGRLGRMKMSHMIGDTEAELHAMADRLGVARRWYQGDHYDISIGKRRLAIRLGAVAISWRQLGAMHGVRQRLGKLPRPDEAVAILKSLMEIKRQAVQLTALQYSLAMLFHDMDDTTCNTTAIQGDWIKAHSTKR